MKYRILAGASLGAICVLAQPAAAQEQVAQEVETRAPQSEDAATPPVVVPPPPVVISTSPPPAPPVGRTLPPPAPPAIRPPRISVNPAPPAPPPPPRITADYGPAPRPGADIAPASEETNFARTSAGNFSCFETENLSLMRADMKIRACDRLLPTARGEADGASWRAHILQHRAIGLYLARQDARALEALDESDALVPRGEDMLHDYSTGLGNDLLRALLLDRKGEKAAALELVAKARTMRPIAPSIAASVDTVERRLSKRTLDLAVTQLDRRSRFDPDAANALFIAQVLRGEYEDAARSGERLALRDPKLRGKWNLVDGPTDEEKVQRRVMFDLLRAYNEHARGNTAEAQQKFAEIDQGITDYVGEDPSKQRRPRRAGMKAYEARKANEPKLRQFVTSMKAMVELRDRIGELDSKAFMEQARLAGDPAVTAPAMLDMMRLVAADEDPEKGEAVAQFIDFLGERILFGNDIEDRDLGKILPERETLADIPKLGWSGSDWLFGEGPGYSQAKEPGGDIRTIRFESDTAPRAVVEEMLLLAIARYAEKDGFDGFVLLSNRTVRRQIIHYGYTRSSLTTDAGFVSDARVHLVKTGNLPPELAGQEDRVITIAEVRERLMPRYGAYQAEKDAQREARRRR